MTLRVYIFILVVFKRYLLIDKKVIHLFLVTGMKHVKLLTFLEIIKIQLQKVEVSIGEILALLPIL